MVCRSAVARWMVQVRLVVAHERVDGLAVHLCWCDGFTD